jgi:hypothetical protein
MWYPSSTSNLCLDSCEWRRQWQHNTCIHENVWTWPELCSWRKSSRTAQAGEEGSIYATPMSWRFKMNFRQRWKHAILYWDRHIHKSYSLTLYMNVHTYARRRRLAKSWPWMSLERRTYSLPPNLWPTMTCRRDVDRPALHQRLVSITSKLVYMLAPLDVNGLY